MDRQSLKKYMQIFSFIVVVVSSLVGFVKFFSVSELPVISGDYDLNDSTNKGRQLNFVEQVARYDGKIVYFDKVMLSTDMENSRYSTDDFKREGIVGYFFNFSDLARPEMRMAENISNDEFVKDLIKYYELPENSFPQLMLMKEFGMSGANASIFVNGKNNDRNVYSDFSPWSAEGTVDYIDGPFQIKNVSGSEAVVYELTVPSIDSEQRKQVECTKKQWSPIVKKFLCQFL